MYCIMVSRFFEKRGHTVLRFNFRGVGASTGKGSWRGSHEQNDVLSCCSYVLKQVPYVKEIILVGYSYGSVIASSCVNQMDEIIGFAAISYPFGPLTFMLLGHLLEEGYIHKPKFFIMGKSDNFTSESTFVSSYNKFPEPKQMILLPDVDHFWFGHEKSLFEPLLEWVESTIVEHKNSS